MEVLWVSLLHLGQQIKLRGRAGVLPITLCRASGQSHERAYRSRPWDEPQTGPRLGQDGALDGPEAYLPELPSSVTKRTIV